MDPPRKKRKLQPQSNNRNSNSNKRPQRQRVRSSNTNNSNRNRNRNHNQNRSNRNNQNRNNVGYPIMNDNEAKSMELFYSKWNKFIQNHSPNNLDLLNGLESFPSSMDFSFDINNMSPSTASNAPSLCDNDQKDDQQRLQNQNENQQISAWKAKYENMNKKYLNELDKTAKLSKDLRNLQQEFDKMKAERNFYQLRLKGLSQMIKSGPAPQFILAPMHKQNPRISQKINHFTNIIHKHHQQTKKNNEYTVKINNHNNHKWIPKNQLCATIKNHVTKNSVNNTKPMLLIRNKESLPQRRKTSKRKSKPQRLSRESSLESNISCDMNDYGVIPYDAIVEKFVIREHRIDALKNSSQRGLRAKIDIPGGTVIGQYVGTEYGLQEWKNVFGSSNEEAMRNVYAFDQTLKIPIRNGDKIEYKEEQIIIDGHGLRELINAEKRNGKQSEYSAHLLYINDCRIDINLTDPSDEDSKYWNVDFVSAEINGYSMVFVVARRNILKGEELLAWYGADYHRALEQQHRFDRIQNSICSLVDNSVLRGVDLNDSDIWLID